MHSGSAPDQRTTTGTIIAVQEERFHLHTDDEQHLVLTAAPGALGRQDLDELRQDNTRVRVRFTGQPHFATGVAKSIRALRGG